MTSSGQWANRNFGNQNSPPQVTYRWAQKPSALPRRAPRKPSQSSQRCGGGPSRAPIRCLPSPNRATLSVHGARAFCPAAGRAERLFLSARRLGSAGRPTPAPPARTESARLRNQGPKESCLSIHLSLLGLSVCLLVTTTVLQLYFRSSSDQSWMDGWILFFLKDLRVFVRR